MANEPTRFAPYGSPFRGKSSEWLKEELLKKLERYPGQLRDIDIFAPEGGQGGPGTVRSRIPTVPGPAMSPNIGSGTQNLLGDIANIFSMAPLPVPEVSYVRDIIDAEIDPSATVAPIDTSGRVEEVVPSQRSPHSYRQLIGEAAARPAGEGVPYDGGIEIDPNTGMPGGAPMGLGVGMYDPAPTAFANTEGRTPGPGRWLNPDAQLAFGRNQGVEPTEEVLKEIVIDQQRRGAAPPSAAPSVPRFDLGEQDPNFVGPGSSLMNQVPDGAGPQSWQERLFGFGGGDPGMNMMMTGLRMLGNASQGQGFGQSLAGAYTAQTGDARQLEAQSYARNQAKLDRELSQSELTVRKEALAADTAAAERRDKLLGERNVIARDAAGKLRFQEKGYEDLERVDNELLRYPDPNSAEHKKLLAERAQIISRIDALKTSGFNPYSLGLPPGATTTTKTPTEIAAEQIYGTL